MQPMPVSRIALVAATLALAACDPPKLKDTVEEPSGLLRSMAFAYDENGE